MVLQRPTSLMPKEAKCCLSGKEVGATWVRMVLGFFPRWEGPRSAC
jgi:hypothetical protein